MRNRRGKRMKIERRKKLMMMKMRNRKSTKFFRNFMQLKLRIERKKERR